VNLEIWTPKEQQLKTMAADWMNRRMGDGWREEFHTDEKDWGVRGILGWRGQCCYFLMTASTEPQSDQTLTAQLYRDSLGTALLDCGRKLLRDYVEQQRNVLKNQYESRIVNKRYSMCGPGLNGVPMEVMNGLYEALEGWRIGIFINKFGILIPEKSCGGWYEPVEDDRSDVSNRSGFEEAQKNCKTGAGDCGGLHGADRGCRAGAVSSGCQPGPGCLFCQLRDGQCKKK